MSKKFKHLESQIDAEVIENTPVHLLDENRLPESKTHFQKIKEKHCSNPKIWEAVDKIIVKIDNIINLGRKDFSWEIMKAANNDEYLSRKIVA